jgi:hypothetical protein
MPALEAILLRPPRSVGEDVQLRLVQKLAELQTAEVTRFLASFQNRWPAHGSLAVRKALTNASNVQTVGSP